MAQQKTVRFIQLVISSLIQYLSTIYFKEVCQDIINGKTDYYAHFAHDCTYYYKYPKYCGRYDDDDFSANSMCCACKGKI